MTKYVEITKMVENTPDVDILKFSKKYKLLEECQGGVYIYANEKEPKYFLYNDQFKEVKEEEQMTKYAKITRHSGFNDIDERNGLEIGKTYKIVSYEDDLTNDCRIYLNDKHPSYFISESQYELVEKEYPTATITVDIEKQLNDRIELLHKERMNIIDKMERMEVQQYKLHNKINKLNEAKKALEILKEFK